jgi:hypothetical protein
VPRFILDIGRDGDQRVSGQLTREGRWASPFSGWLELLQLLEDLADDTANPLEGAE